MEISIIGFCAALIGGAVFKLNKEFTEFKTKSTALHGGHQSAIDNINESMHLKIDDYV